MGQRLGTNDVGYDASRLNTLTLNTIVSSANVDAITDLTGDVIASGPGIVGATLRIPITIPDPAVTSGDGVFIKHTATPFSVAVPAGSGLSLIDLNFKNTGLATSQFYGLKIQTDDDVVDTGAGVAIFNAGRADSIYINVAGKASNAASNTPTGVGIDINKEIASSSERASANSSQQGIQIFDWSTTNQGVGGPRGILLLKIANRNTDHWLMSYVANRRAAQFIVATGDAGYDGSQSLITVSDETTPADWWQIRADATQIYAKDGAGIQWITPGSKTAYIIASGNDLKLKSGGTAIRFVNQADTDFGILMQDNLDVIMGLAGSTSATHGFPHMPAAAGIPAGSPTTYAGWQPYTFDTTNNDFYVFNAGWKKVGSVNGVTGTSANTRLTFWTGTTTVSGDAALVWDNTNKFLGINVTPTHRFHAVDNLISIWLESAGNPMSALGGLHLNRSSALAAPVGLSYDVDGVSYWDGGLDFSTTDLVLALDASTGNDVIRVRAGGLWEIGTATGRPPTNSVISIRGGGTADASNSWTCLRVTDQLTAHADNDILYIIRSDNSFNDAGHSGVKHMALYLPDGDVTLAENNTTTVGANIIFNGSTTLPVWSNSIELNNETGVGFHVRSFSLQIDTGAATGSPAHPTYEKMAFFTPSGNLMLGGAVETGAYKLQVDGAVLTTGNVITGEWLAPNGDPTGVIVDAWSAGFKRVGLVKYPFYEAGLFSGMNTVVRIGHRTDSDDLTAASPTLREDIRISTAGNVGIGGITSPTAHLHLPAGGTAANTAPLKLTTQAAPLTTVEQGTFELVGNSLQFSQLARRRGVAMSQNTRTADFTLAASSGTSESAAVVTSSHGAGYLEVGKSEEIVMVGTMSQRSNPNAKLTIRVKYAGATVLTFATAINTAIAANSAILIRIYCTCRTTGATGTMQINAVVEINGTATDPQAASLVTINTTAAEDTTATFQWGSDTDAANTITINQARVLCVEPSK